MRFIVIMSWYNKYLNIPFKHLGQSPISGMDCYSLCRYVYEQEKHESIPYLSYEHCNIVDDDWYLKTSDSIFETIVRTDNRWKKILEPAPFDFVLMSIGSTNVSNHCALYVATNKVLHIMQNKPSWVAPFRGYYEQYTTGIYRWTSQNY